MKKKIKFGVKKIAIIMLKEKYLSKRKVM